jgi:GntR family transcriptional regulator, phosphonate transport system regulatory protein
MTTQGRSRSGYSAWRLIAEELRREIIGGTRAPGTKLPSEGELAERFGVHRNTVRQAVAALAAEHLVVSRRGSGTFVAEHTVLVHRIGARTRFSDSLGRRGRAAARLLESAVEPEPPAEVADRLALGGRAALRLETVQAVDGPARSCSSRAPSTSWPTARRCKSASPASSPGAWSSTSGM